MLTSKPAQTLEPVLDIIKNRWSPYAIDEKPVETEKINVLLEAARWAPSSYNEQPWSYVIGHSGDENHKKLQQCLAEGNSWAKTAPVLILAIAKSTFSFNHKFNPHYMHDTGAANGYMHLQASALGLHMHQMAGFDSEIARELFNINQETHDPATMIAIGYPGNRDDLPQELKEREEAPRSRKSLTDMLWKE